VTNKYKPTILDHFILPIEGIEQPKGSQLEGKYPLQKPTARVIRLSALACAIEFRVYLYYTSHFSTNPSKVPPCILSCHKGKKIQSPPGSTFFGLDPRTGNICFLFPLV